MFKSHVNRAIASGEKNGEFTRPKGRFSCNCVPKTHVSKGARHDRAHSNLRRALFPDLLTISLGASGTVKLAKKETKPAAPKKEKAETKTEKKTTSGTAKPKKAAAPVSNPFCHLIFAC